MTNLNTEKRFITVTGFVETNKTKDNHDTAPGRQKNMNDVSEDPATPTR
jgi:hypothetical protein